MQLTRDEHLLLLEAESSAAVRSNRRWIVFLMLLVVVMASAAHFLSRHHTAWYIHLPALSRAFGPSTIRLPAPLDTPLHPKLVPLLPLKAAGNPSDRTAWTAGGAAGEDSNAGIPWARPSITQVGYQFIDRPISPLYHRSYAITVTPQTVQTVVFCGEAMLASDARDIGAADFERLLGALASCTLCREPTSPEMCTGGTTEEVNYEIDGEEFRAFVYHCGGKDYGTLCGDVGLFSAAAKALVPNLQELIDSTWDLRG